MPTASTVLFVWTYCNHIDASIRTAKKMPTIAYLFLLLIAITMDKQMAVRKILIRMRTATNWPKIGCRTSSPIIMPNRIKNLSSDPISFFSDFNGGGIMAGLRVNLPV